MITVINNQPIRFRQTDLIDESCECMGQGYCQLINKFDETQYQIKSSSIITNGSFESNLDGWNVFLQISIEIISVVTPEESECDGSFEVLASGGNGGPYTYSIDGINFQSSGIFTDLCCSVYYVIARDVDNNEGVIPINICIDCSLYYDSYLSDLDDVDLFDVELCYLNDFL